MVKHFRGRFALVMSADSTACDTNRVARSGTLTFAPWRDNEGITTEVQGDSTNKANEYFSLDLFEFPVAVLPFPQAPPHRLAGPLMFWTCPAWAVS
jgi:hypothetical protein